MKQTGWTLAAAGLVTATGLSALTGAPAGADDADPAVVAAREAAAETATPEGYDAPPDVQPSSGGSVCPSRRLSNHRTRSPAASFSWSTRVSFSSIAK